MAGTADRTLLLSILADTSKAEKGLKRLGRVIVGAIAVDKILDFGKAAVTMADDVDQAEGKLDQLLGSQAKAVKAFAKQTKGIGISRRNTLKYTSSLAALMRVQGANRQEAAKSSVQWVRLAADMAAFNNAAPDEVLQAMQAALAGEFDPLKRFGVLLNATKVQQYAWATGIAKTGKALTDRQKLLATEGLLLKQTRLQQGQLRRESGTLGAKQNRLNALFEDFQAAIGEKLLGPMSDLAGFLADDVAPALGSMAKDLGTITGLGPDTGASLIILAGGLGVLAAIAVAHPILAIAAAIGALGIAAAIVVNSGVLQDFHDQAIDARYALRVGEEVSPMQRAILGLYDAMQAVGAPIKGFFDDVAATWAGAQAIIAGDYSNLLGTIIAITSVAFAPFVAMWRLGLGIVEGIADQFGINLKDTFGNIRDKVVGIFQNLIGGIRDLWNSLDISIPPFELTWGGGTVFPNTPIAFDIPRGSFRFWSGTGDLFPDIGVRTPPAPVGGSAPGLPPRHLHGLDRVPRDDYLMIAHRDEAVLNRYEAREWRGGSNAVHLTVNVNAPVAADGARVGQQLMGYIDQALGRGHRFRYRPVGGLT